MKKLLSVFMGVLLAVSLVFAAACGDNGADTPTGPIDYTVTVQDTAENPVSRAAVSLVQNGTTVRSLVTGDNGQVVFEDVNPAEYNVELDSDSLPAGFRPTQSEYVTDLTGTPIVITLSSSIIMEDAPAGTVYEEGDVIYNFTYEALSRDEEGNIVREEKTLADAFNEGKEMVMINFFYTTCQPCINEVGPMGQAYSDFDDVVEIISIDDYYLPGDTEEGVVNFKEQYEMTWDVASDRNTASYSIPFNVQAYPTNFIIDRYGVICMIETGSITDANTFRNWFERYTGDDYNNSQIGNDWELTPPTVENPDIEDIAAAISSDSLEGKDITFEWDYTSEYNWPWLVSEDGNSIYSSNSGYAGSWSLVSVRFNLAEGEVLAFDYNTSTETSDILYAIVDNMIMGSFSGIQETDWETCYAFVGDGTEHTLSFTYQKDTGSDVGDDTAYISNLRVTDVNELNENNIGLNMLRQAATNLNDTDPDNAYYEDYITPVYNEEDGYYHVGTADGPYLLAEMINDTLWGSGLYTQAITARNSYAGGYIDENSPQYVLVGEYLGTVDDEPVYENFDTIEDYAWYARYSRVTTMANSLSSGGVALTPVTQELKDLLVEIVAALGNSNANDNEQEWLEICRYYRQYGNAAEEITDPIAGLLIDTAIEVGMGTYENIETFPKAPRGIVFSFTPTTSSAYVFTSSNIAADNVSEGGVGTVAWLFDENYGDSSNPRYIAEADSNGTGGNFSLVYQLTAGETYYIACALTDNNITGSFDLNIAFYDEDFIIRPAASDAYSYDETTGEIFLNTYVKAELRSDGNYYAVGDDGTDYGLLYLDVANGTTFSTMPLTNWLQNQKLEVTIDGVDTVIEGYGFDFTENGYYKKYYDYLEARWNEALAAYIAEGGTREGFIQQNGGEFVNRYDLLTDEQKQDFTAEMTELLANPNSYGFVVANDRIVEILQILMELEDRLTDNAWMQLCYYIETFD